MELRKRIPCRSSSYRLLQNYTMFPKMISENVSCLQVMMAKKEPYDFWDWMRIS